ncbi:carbon monoxide dehydrogenase, partial [Micromonospora sp. NPDC005313]
AAPSAAPAGPSSAIPPGTILAGAPVVASASTGRPAAGARAEPAAEAQTLDLLDIAGGAVVKRLVPVLVGIVVVGAVIAWRVARR